MIQPILRLLGNASSGGTAFDNREVGTAGFDGFTRSPWPAAGTMRDLVIEIEVPPGTGNSRTFTVEVNGTPSALAVTISGTATTGRDTTNVLTIAAGDLVRLVCTSSGTPPVTNLRWTLDFHSTNTGESGYTTNVATNTTGYVNPLTGGRDTTLSLVEAYIPCPGTVTALYGANTYTSVSAAQHLYVYIYKNGVKQDGTGGTVNTRLDITNVAVNTALNTTFSLPVVRGDRIALGLEVSGSYPNSWTGIGLRFVADTDGYSIVAGSGSSTPSASTPYYIPLHRSDSLGYYGTDVWQSRLLAGVTSFSIRDLYVGLTASPGVGRSRTFTVRVNGADSIVSAAVTDTATTGSDLDLVACVDGDLINLLHTPAGSPDTSGDESWSVVIQDPYAVPPTGDDLSATLQENLRLSDRSLLPARVGALDCDVPGFEVLISARIEVSYAGTPIEILTGVNHGIQTGDLVEIVDHSVAAVNGTHIATRINATMFSIPGTLGTGGTDGRVFAVRRYAPGTIRITEAINSRGRAQTDIVSMDGDYRPQIDDEVIYREHCVELFRGLITEEDQKGRVDGAGTPIVCPITVADFSIFAERRLVNWTFPGGTLQQLLTELIRLCLADAPYSVTLHPLQPVGPTLNPKIYAFRRLKEVLDETTTDAGGYVWLIDKERRLLMYEPTMDEVTAPFNIAEGDGNIEGDLEVHLSNEGYANRIWVRAGANAEPTDRYETCVTPCGTVVGGTTEYYPTPIAFTFLEQPTEILVNGVAHPIGAPGSTNDDQPWEWRWKWIGTGTGLLGVRPALVHNDTAFGTTAPGTTLALNSRGINYYNIVQDRWYGGSWNSVSDGYRWYWGGWIPTRNRTLPPHTIWIKLVGAAGYGDPYPVGIYGTLNDGQPWDVVWRDDVNPPQLGYREALPAPTNAYEGSIYSLAPYELLVQYPPASSEPTFDQLRYGVQEDIIDAPDVFDATAALNLAQQYYLTRSLRGVGVKYMSLNGTHLTPGLVQYIDASGYRKVDDDFMLIEVETADREKDSRIERTVSAVNSSYWRNTWRDAWLQWVGPGGQTRPSSLGIPNRSLGNIAGTLPLTSLERATASPRLLGRGSGTAGEWQPIIIGQNLTMDGTTLVADEFIGQGRGILVSIGDGSSPITVGDKVFAPDLPYHARITSCTLFTKDVAGGSITLDVTRAAYADAPTMVSIVGSAPPTLSSARKSQDTTLTGWDVNLNAGDVLGFTVATADGVLTQVSIMLRMVERAP